MILDRSHRPLAGWTATALSSALLVLALLDPRPVHSQAATGAEAGAAIWEDANCAGCHGDNGQGGTHPDLPPGPSLHKMTLDRSALIEVISCGRKGTPMPAWLKGAYRQTPCYKAPVGAVPDGVVAIDAYDAAQIAQLADFIESNFVGK